MISDIDPSEPVVADRIVEIQQAAYAVEAELIGFDGIPPLTETAAQVAGSDLRWRGAADDGQLAGVIAWSVHGAVLDIERLAVDPAFSRRGHGRALLRSLPSDTEAIVSTGRDNAPALALYRSLGFVAFGETEIAAGVFMTDLRRVVEEN